MPVLETTGLATAPLSVAMRSGSRVEHERAESSSFMAALLAGRVDEAGYAAYLHRLRPVYAALESVSRQHADDPAVAAVSDPAIERLAALDADLAHWAPDGRAPATSAASETYTRRVLESGAWGGLYVAHHYTRYLGDLSGGQAIGRILTREFDLQDGVGVAFYDFPAVPKPKLYKDAYRARLDALAPSATEKTRIVEEVRLAFRLNQAVFAELDATLDGCRRTPRGDA